MKKQFWLIKRITTAGHKNSLQIVDVITTDTLKEAKREFEGRNDFKKLLKKAYLTIAESRLFFQ